VTADPTAVVANGTTVVANGTAVVANGVELGAFASAGSRSTRRPVDVLFVGRLIEEKGVDLLLRAVAALVPSRANLRVSIVGEGPEGAALESLAEGLGIAGNVTFHGRIPDDEVVARMAAARLLVLPSTREGFGITVAEAQAAGAVPVVTRGPLTAAPDLVRDGRDGLVVDPTVEALAAAIEGLLRDRRTLARLSAAARATAAGRGWDERAAEMEQVYIDVVTARRGLGFSRDGGPAARATARPVARPATDASGQAST
jgi:glycosyltransferase involved in cell wall biosynthesis